MKYYIEAKKKMDMENIEFTGGVSANKIEKAMKKLSLAFPKSYIAFLSDFGAGDIGGEIIFGITNIEDENVVKITQMEHEYKMPKSMVVINYNEAHNSLYCLDTNQMKEGECPVVEVFDDYQRIDFIADSFGKFLYDYVCEE